MKYLAHYTIVKRDAKEEVTVKDCFHPDYWRTIHANDLWEAVATAKRYIRKNYRMVTLIQQEYDRKRYI